MPTASMTALKLDTETKERVERFASARQRSAESVVREALEDYLSRAEKRDEFRLATLAAAEHYRATGLHLTEEEADEWMLKLEAGEDVPPPECHL